MQNLIRIGNNLFKLFLLNCSLENLWKIPAVIYTVNFKAEFLCMILNHVIRASPMRILVSKRCKYHWRSKKALKSVTYTVKNNLDRLQYSNMFSYPSYKYTEHEYTLVTPVLNTLQFESRFESGNLSKAIKISENEYNLYLENDIETKGHTQWYYFSIANFKENHTVRFNIVNLIKPESLYKSGLCPWVLSKAEQAISQSTWKREGFDIQYTTSFIPRKFSTAENPANYYKLSFSYTFKHPNDLVFFAHCFPFTYSDLVNYLESLSQNSVLKSFLTISSLCKTLAGNICPVLTITEHVNSFEKELEGKLFKHKNKKVIVLTARVHPGETNSSYIIKGLIDFLLSGQRVARSLRKKFVFRIVPMLNPDGVIYGNYRCSLLGVDLNRRWKEPNVWLHPTIFHTKEMIARLKSSLKIFFFCDFHGHSTKKDTFIYGCRTKCSNLIENKENIYIRLFPLFFAKISQNFNYANCKFKIEKVKESTARVVLFKEFNILMSYTLETSFYGASNDPGNVFDIENLTKIGEDFCKILNLFKSPLKLVRNTEKIYSGLVFLHNENKLTDFSQAIEALKPEFIENIIEINTENNDSDSDSVCSEDDDKMIEFKNNKSKIKTKRKIKKITPIIITKSNIRPPVTCAPSSLARSNTAIKINAVLNNTLNFRLRKGSLRKIKTFGNKNTTEK